MQIIQLHSMAGCGTHLVLDLFNSIGIERLDDPVFLLQAMRLAREDAAAPCRLQSYEAVTSAQALEQLSRKIRVPLPSDLSSDKACFECFFDAVKGMNRERMVIGHQFYLSHSIRPGTANGDEHTWTLEDRDNAQVWLERALAHLGIDFRQVAVLRHPVDIYFSQIERSRERQSGSKEIMDFKKSRVEKEIGEFFSLVAKKADPKSFPVVLYEELCRAHGGDLDRLLAKLQFSPTDLGRVDRSFIHGGNLEKWRLYPASEVSAVAESLRPCMAPFGYVMPRRNGLADALVRSYYRCRKYRAEFKVINRLMAGDFSVDSAFSRHNRSIPARMWFRFRLLFSGPRMNVERFYQTRKDTASTPVRPLGVVLRELIRRRY